MATAEQQPPQQETFIDLFPTTPPSSSPLDLPAHYRALNHPDNPNAQMFMLACVAWPVVSKDDPSHAAVFTVIKSIDARRHPLLQRVYAATLVVQPAIEALGCYPRDTVCDVIACFFVLLDRGADYAYLLRHIFHKVYQQFGTPSPHTIVVSCTERMPSYHWESEPDACPLANPPLMTPVYFVQGVVGRQYFDDCGGGGKKIVSCYCDILRRTADVFGTARAPPPVNAQQQQQQCITCVAHYSTQIKVV